MRAPRWIWPFLALLLSAPPLAAQTPDYPSRVRVEVGAGQRLAHLRWNIGNAGPEDPISELTYSRIAVREILLRAGVRVWSDDARALLIGAEGRFGEIWHGRVRDSDYSGPARAQEDVRSVADLTGQVLRSEAAAIGMRFGLPGHWPASDVIGWLGARRSRHLLRMQNGVHILPRERPMQGLDSRYEALWSGPFVAVEPRLSHGPIRFEARFAAHVAARYSATGQWNLREELVQPRSFDQSGVGRGWEARLQASVPLGDRPTLTVQGHYIRLRLEDGEDRLYVAARPARPGQPGSAARTVHTTLNEVAWNDFGLQVRLSIDL